MDIDYFFLITVILTSHNETEKKQLLDPSKINS